MEKDYLLDKWLNQRLSEAEMQEFRQREDYEELVAILENAKSFKASNFSGVGDFEHFPATDSEEISSPKGVSWIRPILRIAAVLVLGVAVFYFLSRDNATVIQTLAGEKKTLDLPDASTVVVNALSEIRFDEASWPENRLVELKGEAYFDVVSGSSFQVNTSVGVVTVLGTEFNVKERTDYFEVQCYEGRVEVKSGTVKEILGAGEHLKLSDGQLELGKHSTSKPGWTSNISNFMKVPIGEVVDELERQYNVDIRLQKVDPNILFTGAFVHDQFENALKSVTEPLDLQYNIEPNNKVSIYPREP